MVPIQLVFPEVGSAGRKQRQGHPMAEKKLPLLGRIAIQLKMIDMDQLNQATREQGLSPEKRLGQILVEQGLVTAKDLEKLAAVQKDLIAKNQARKDAELKAETRSEGPPEAPGPKPSAPGKAADSALRSRPRDSGSPSQLGPGPWGQ